MKPELRVVTSSPAPAQRPQQSRLLGLQLEKTKVSVVITRTRGQLRAVVVLVALQQVMLMNDIIKLQV